MEDYQQQERDQEPLSLEEHNLESGRDHLSVSHGNHPIVALFGFVLALE